MTGALNRRLTRRSSRRPTRFAACPRLSLVVRRLRRHMSANFGSEGPMINRLHLSCLAGLIVLASTTGTLATDFKIDVVPTVIGPSEVEVEIRSNIPVRSK